MGSTSTDVKIINGNSDSEAPTWDLNGSFGNLAFVLQEKRRFYFEKRPMPTLASENHVIVAVCATGLCGSDVRTSALCCPFLQVVLECFD
jgi:hypothetical protein